MKTLWWPSAYRCSSIAKVQNKKISSIELQKFNPSFVIVQWSAVQRGYTSNQTDVVEAIVKNREVLFSHYDTEYWSDNVKVGYASNGFDDLTHETYVTAFTHITLLQNYLERKGIKYLFFWFGFIYGLWILH